MRSMLCLIVLGLWIETRGRVSVPGLRMPVS
jgi:hypothetical protein